MDDKELNFGNTTTIDENSSNQNDKNKNNSVVKEGEITSFNKPDVDDITGNDGKKVTDNTDSNLSTGSLQVGDSVNVDGIVYTVSDNGDLVDKEGKIFKEAKDINDWLKTVEVDDNDSNETAEININNLQKIIGIEVTDENGNPVEFTNDIDGVNSYIKSVIDIKSNELQEVAVNRIFTENPMLKQFIDYVQITGSPRGFGELPDRSGIQLDKDNENQLIAVIKMAAQEFGNKSLSDGYIKYLKDSHGLYDVAREQLQALVEKDKAHRKEIETRAQQERDEEEKSLQEYWSNVEKVIQSRTISGYKLPETFTKEIDGKKVLVTLNDFYKFVSKPTYETEDGRKVTGYQNALNNLTDEEYLHREMLDAWLVFTGGTYKDLIDMAIKDDKVKQLRIKSKEQRTTKSVKVIKAKTSKTNINDIVL